MRVTLADLGIGNIHSLAKALAHEGAQVDVTASSDAWLDAAVLVLPGVGSFGAGMRALEPVRDALHAKFLSGAPALGVCLGMQLLFERSDEDPVEGLGFVSGDVKRLPDAAGKIPHMGWSTVETKDKELFDGIPSGSHFYFVHSFYPDPEDDVGIAQTKYGVNFTSVIKKANTFGTQFHPEKSGPNGLRLLRNFLAHAEAHL